MSARSSAAVVFIFFAGECPYGKRHNIYTDNFIFKLIFKLIFVDRIDSQPVQFVLNSYSIRTQFVKRRYSTKSIASPGPWAYNRSSCCTIF